MFRLRSVVSMLDFYIVNMKIKLMYASKIQKEKKIKIKILKNCFQVISSNFQAV